MTEESRPVFAEMWARGVGRHEKGHASDKSWTQHDFNVKLKNLKAYRHRPNTTEDKESDRKNFDRWSAGGSVGPFYGAAIQEMFLGNPPACDTVGKRNGVSSSDCACEPCRWKRRLDSWLTTSKKGRKTNVPREQPASAETAEAKWSGGRALKSLRKFVELHIHDTTGSTPHLTVSLSYSYGRFNLPKFDELPELRVKIQPTSLVIHLKIRKAQKIHRTIFQNDRVSYGSDRWIVNASRAFNDTFPLVEQALVQLEQTLPGAVVTLTVTCSQDDLDPEIENPPEGATATDLRVLERVFQKWHPGMEEEEIVLARGALRRTP
ncbi:MAG: hypothetical protein ING82_05225 [Roseomonas sp.]|nr:hypothetical protein [Roseomonas sp.]